MPKPVPYNRLQTARNLSYLFLLLTYSLTLLTLCSYCQHTYTNNALHYHTCWGPVGRVELGPAEKMPHEGKHLVGKTPLADGWRQISHPAGEAIAPPEEKRALNIQDLSP